MTWMLKLVYKGSKVIITIIYLWKNRRQIKYAIQIYERYKQTNPACKQENYSVWNEKYTGLD